MIYQVKQISTKWLTKNFINGYSIFNGAIYFIEDGSQIVCRMKVLNLLLYQIIVIIKGWIIVISLNFGQKLNESLNMLIWPINLIISNITGSLIVLNAIIENENNSFANISIPLLIMQWTWSKEKNQNISETILFIFNHGIQHNEVSDYTLHD